VASDQGLGQRKERVVEERLSTVHLLEVSIKSKDIEFSGEVYVGYASESYWMPTGFVGVITDDGLIYRGNWAQGPEFDKLSKAFMGDPRLVEVAVGMITKRVNLFKKDGDGGQ
jgi:hypothetical protein